MERRFSRIELGGLSLWLVFFLSMALGLGACTKTRESEPTISQKVLTLFFADPTENGACCITSSLEKCDECIKSYCATDCANACANPVSVELLSCGAECRENDESCFERCKATRPEGVKELLFLEIEGCAGAHCFTECGY